MLLVAARLQGFDRSLERAASDLGANAFRRLRYVVLPLIAPGGLRRRAVRVHALARRVHHHAVPDRRAQHAADLHLHAGQVRDHARGQRARDAAARRVADPDRAGVRAAARDVRARGAGAPAVEATLRTRGRKDRRCARRGDAPPEARCAVARRVSGVKADGDTGPPTWKDVAPNLRQFEVRRLPSSAGIAPFALVGARDAQVHAAAILKMTQLGAMPPWPPSLRLGAARRNRTSRVLTADEKDADRTLGRRRARRRGRRCRRRRSPLSPRGLMLAPKAPYTAARRRRRDGRLPLLRARAEAAQDSS